jgi:hypothetical protein
VESGGLTCVLFSLDFLSASISTGHRHKKITGSSSLLGSCFLPPIHRHRSQLSMRGVVDCLLGILWPINRNNFCSLEKRVFKVSFMGLSYESGC